MSELTFAELGFLLRACPDSADLVRAALRLTSDSKSDIVVAAGLASLLARGPAACGPMTARSRCPPRFPLSSLVCPAPTVAVSALGWVGEGQVLAHLFGDARCRMAVCPRGPRSVRGGGARTRPKPVSAVLSRSSSMPVSPVAVRQRCWFGPRGAACRWWSVAIEPVGCVALSDSVDTPDRSVPVDPAGVRRRFAELFDTDPVLGVVVTSAALSTGAATDTGRVRTDERGQRARGRDGVRRGRRDGRPSGR